MPVLSTTAEPVRSLPIRTQPVLIKTAGALLAATNHGPRRLDRPTAPRHSATQPAGPDRNPTAIARRT